MILNSLSRALLFSLLTLIKKGTKYREIFRLIYLSGLDIPDILKRSKKFSFLCLRSKLNKLRFSEGLSFLEQHTELLEIPIVLSDKHAVSGYDEQQIKSFLL
ncbi:ArsC/Spx/MgsR family protein [Lactococcus petauri]|uniref:ArsC/Spx/MgsR family protein n=1 Tax=Lactococcus petauri TaxID=1940789 RepID=UPI00255010FC|nr:ArsC/Spx/MgsR family protein [Lactococcus petauri]